MSALVRPRAPARVHILEGTDVGGRKWTACSRLLPATASTVGCRVLKERAHLVTCQACRRKYSLAFAPSKEESK